MNAMILIYYYNICESEWKSSDIQLHENETIDFIENEIGNQLGMYVRHIALKYQLFTHIPINHFAPTILITVIS